MCITLTILCDQNILTKLNILQVINEVDYNLPPLNFTFVRDRYAGKGVHISDDTLIGEDHNN